MKSLKQLPTLLAIISAAIIAFACQQHTQDNATTAPETITQIAASNPNFSTLVTALKATGLDKVLNSPGEYTVFAPTNAAFDKLPAGTVTNLLKPENLGQLKEILLYHVVKGKVPASAVKSGSVETLAGSAFDVDVSKSGVMLNNSAKVTKTDLMASNGIIHVINSVLLPPKK